MKPLIIGEAPSKNEPTPRPIEGRIGKRLAMYANMPLQRFLDHFDRVNLLAIRQDTAEHGFTFDVKAARVEADKLQREFKRGQVVILLGGRVAEAFGVHDDYFVENPLGLAKAYIVPHPSGINRWHNDPANRIRMSVFMAEIVERTLVHV